jgi:chromosome segregation ATPase
MINMINSSNIPNAVQDSSEKKLKQLEMKAKRIENDKKLLELQEIHLKQVNQIYDQEIKDLNAKLLQECQENKDELAAKKHEKNYLEQKYSLIKQNNNQLDAKRVHLQQELMQIQASLVKRNQINQNLTKENSDLQLKIEKFKNLYQNLNKNLKIINHEMHDPNQINKNIIFEYRTLKYENEKIKKMFINERLCLANVPCNY